MNDQLLMALAAALTRQKAVSSTPSSIYPHGEGGLFSQPALNQDILNAMSTPRPGLGAMLPVRPSNLINPLYGVLTGMTASSGSNPTTPCADGKQPGNLLLCQRLIPFGRIPMDSQVIQIDRAGELASRGDFLDHNLVGNPFAGPTSPISVDPREALRSNSKKKLLELMVAYDRDNARLLYAGNPSNTTGSEGYIEFNGLDIQLNTGSVDAISTTACAAVDSIVKAAGGIDIATNGGVIVTKITEIYNALQHRAAQAGLAPGEDRAVDDLGVFRALTAVWPCSYLTSGCSVSGNQEVNVNAADQVAMRDAMRAGKYLLIDGQKVPVIEDVAIAETVISTGVYQSDIYFVPLTILGSRPATYWEYFNFDGPYGAMEAAADFAAAGTFTTFGSGRFLLHKKPPTNWCAQIGLLGKPRVICEAPFLGGRFTGLRYTPFIHEVSPFLATPTTSLAATPPSNFTRRHLLWVAVDKRRWGLRPLPRGAETSWTPRPFACTTPAAISGAVSFVINERTYRGGTDPMHDAVDAAPEDVPGLLATGRWVVAPPVVVEPTEPTTAPVPSGAPAATTDTALTTPDELGGDETAASDEPADEPATPDEPTTAPPVSTPAPRPRRTTAQ